jgi:3-oxoacyl-[acyl-carrier-protein] synthase II
MNHRRVVITGIGAITPLGLNASDSWQAVCQGRCGIAPITLFDTTAQKVKLAGEVKNFIPEEHLGKQESKRMGRFTQFAVVAARAALKDSGLTLESTVPDRCGVIVSSGIGGQAITETEHLRGIQQGFDKVSPFYIPTTICNMAAGQIAIDAGFQGMCTCPVTACAGGSNAVGDAFHYIRDGYAEVMLCGGTEASITPLSIGGFTSMKALTLTEDPNRASIPFDKERSGFVMGEGAGILLLEELEHARKRSAKIYAEVVGYGATCDAYHMTAPHPEARGGAQAMKDALREAGYTESDRVYINAHGTGTPMNDKVEIQAIKLALGEEAASRAHVSSTKSMTGHMLGAAGAIEAMACLLALRDGIIPPTIHLDSQDPVCDLNCTPNTAVVQEIDLALSNSLGFGGHNACLAFRKVTV